MSAKKAALAMEKGIRPVFPDIECVIVPMADGGNESSHPTMAVFL
jgi:glycerate 2-kinase